MVNIDKFSNGAEPRHLIVSAVRSLMPHRALEAHEAQGLAERQAMRLLKLLGINEAPIDLDAIAALPRLEVRVAPGLPVSGFSEWSGSKWLIALRAEEPLLRQRFTLAHELKHVLDNPYIDGLYLDHRGKPSIERAEAICDYFAGCLLMPRPWLKSAWTRGHQDVRDLASHFGVSQPAMSVRLSQVGLVSPVRRCRSAPIKEAWSPTAAPRRYGRALPVDWPSPLTPSLMMAPAPGWAT